MLRVLSMRVWREGLVAPRGETDAKGGASPRPQAAPSKVGGAQEHVAVVVGNLQDTYQQFQYQVSAKLARLVPSPSFEYISQSLGVGRWEALCPLPEGNRQAVWMRV